MALKAIIDTTEGLDENIAALYTEQKEGPAAGKYLLDVEGSGGFALENVDGLKSALSKERQAKETLERKVDAFGDLDPETARKAIERAEELAKIDPSKEADKIVEERVKAVREKMEKAHGEELSKLASERDSLLSEVDRGARLQAKADAFDKHGVIPERRKPLEAYVDRFLKTEISDGKRLVSVVDESGAPIIAKDGSNMDVSRFVEDLKNDDAFAPFFKGVDRTGGGTPPNGSGAGGPGKTMSRAEFEGISDPAQKMEIAQSHRITD